MLAFTNRTKLWHATSTPILQVEALYISLVMLGSGMGLRKVGGTWPGTGDTTVPDGSSTRQALDGA